LHVKVEVAITVLPHAFWAPLPLFLGGLFAFFWWYPFVWARFLVPLSQNCNPRAITAFESCFLLSILNIKHPHSGPVRFPLTLQNLLLLLAFFRERRHPQAFLAVSQVNFHEVF